MTLTRMILAGLLCSAATPAVAQLAGTQPATGPVEAKNPPQAPGEYGPVAPIASPEPLAQLISGNGTDIHVDGEGAPDDVGAFRGICRSGPNRHDDPIVAPKKKGGGPHGHQFYGNEDITYKIVSYDDIRTMSAASGCGGKGNRTGYWMPELLSGLMVLRPEYVSLYYKRFPKGSVHCQQGHPQFVGICVGVPNDLRMIFGYDFITGKAPTGAVRFKVVKPDSNNRTEFAPDLVETASHALPGDMIDVVINAPDCWNGKDVDSPNHRDHVSYTDETTGKCPSTHPYLIPHFTLQAFYTVDANLDRSGTWTPSTNTWYFSCDKMPGMPTLRPGTCVHQDYLEGWDPRVKKAWTDNCIDRLLNCSGWELGNGYGMRPDFETLYKANPRYVKPAAKARGAVTSNTAFIGHDH